MALKRLTNVPRTIETISGTKYYIGTEIEDKYGRWDDGYYTPAFYVIHKGGWHHVYGDKEHVRQFRKQMKK